MSGEHHATWRGRRTQPVLVRTSHCHRRGPARQPHLPPGSGTSFGVGTTAVGCTAVDALSRQSQCSFTVTLTPLLLSVTKFVAFGDSFTEGEDGRTLTLRHGFGFIDPNRDLSGPSAGIAQHRVPRSVDYCVEPRHQRQPIDSDGRVCPPSLPRIARGGFPAARLQQPARVDAIASNPPTRGIGQCVTLATERRGDGAGR